MQHLFAYGIIIVYAYGFIKCFQFVMHFAHLNLTSGRAFLSGCGFFFTLIHRNFRVFVSLPMSFPPDVMASNFLGAGFAFFFVYFLWKYRNERADKLKKRIAELEDQVAYLQKQL